MVIFFNSLQTNLKSILTIPAFRKLSSNPQLELRMAYRVLTNELLRSNSVLCKLPHVLAMDWCLWIQVITQTIAHPYQGSDRNFCHPCKRNEAQSFLTTAVDNVRMTECKNAALFHLFEEKMLAEGMSDAAIAAFQRNYDALVSGASTTLAETDIEPVQSVPMLVDLPGRRPRARDVGELWEARGWTFCEPRLEALHFQSASRSSVYSARIRFTKGIIDVYPAQTIVKSESLSNRKAWSHHTNFMKR